MRFDYVVNEIIQLGGKNVKFINCDLIESANEMHFMFNFTFGDEIRFNAIIPENTLNRFDVDQINKYIDESIKELRETLKSFMLILDEELKSWIIE